MTLEALQRQAKAKGLTIRGALHTGPSDGAPVGCQTLVLLGPDEPGFWAIFSDSAENGDERPDPLDRWSHRVIKGLAEDIGASAIFPSDGPPYPPFLRWAQDSGQSFSSPVGLLVHPDAGLFLSFRGALALAERLDVPPPAQTPCVSCHTQPCSTACPVKAMRPGADYDVNACQAYLRTSEGRECLESGCLVRRACPVSCRFSRVAEQSAFHMSAFVKD